MTFDNNQLSTILLLIETSQLQEPELSEAWALLKHIQDSKMDKSLLDQCIASGQVSAEQIEAHRLAGEVASGSLQAPTARPAEPCTDERMCSVCFSGQGNCQNLQAMQMALRALNLYLDWDGKDSSMLGTFDIAATLSKDALSAAIAAQAHSSSKTAEVEPQAGLSLTGDPQAAQAVGQIELAISDAVVERMSKILASISLTVNGPELPLHRHGYHDLDEKVAVLQLEVDLYRHQAIAHGITAQGGA